MSLECVMISCERPYGWRSLASYVRDPVAPPITVHVDAADDEYLGDSRHDERVTTVVGALGSERRRGYVRCRLNTLAALEAAIGRAPEDDILLLEDDIELAERWPAHLEVAREHCRKRHDDFVLALWAGGKAQGRDGPVDGYHYSDYYGTVALVLSSAVARVYAQALSAAVQSGSGGATDMILKDVLWRRRFALRQTRPHLVQHLGDVSTTGAHRVIRSARYRSEP